MIIVSGRYYLPLLLKYALMAYSITPAISVDISCPFFIIIMREKYYVKSASKEATTPIHDLFPETNL